MRRARREFTLAVVAAAFALGWPPPLQAFDAPTPAASRAAVGPLDGAPVILQRLLNPDADFRPVRAPQAGDWLANHPEPGAEDEKWIARQLAKAAAP